MQSTFNNKLRQIILLLIIAIIAFILFKQLYIFLPGFLGAITLYILLRDQYYLLTVKNKWNKNFTSVLFILCSLLVIAIPVFFSINILSTKVSTILSNPTDLLNDAKLVGQKINVVTGIKILSDENLFALQKNAATYLPSIINSSASIISNFAILFFLLFFLLTNGKKIEFFFKNFIPLKKENIELLSVETRKMIKANAIGIPVLALIQGIVATIGYYIFGVKDFALWGFLTGVCSLIPVVGTAIIWLPLTLFLYSISKSVEALGLFIYAIIVITNIDYVVRLTILKKLMNVHPIITILGVIVGIGLFGFWGVIFGPLLINYFIILVNIYINEFGNNITN